MLIRLQPAAPLPTVLFAINFPNLPDHLPTTPAWAAQISALASDDLEFPESRHALDSAAKIPSIVEELSFDIPTLTVSCRFVDGFTEEWPLMGAGFIEALESVLDDVSESSLETEREKQREKEKLRKLAVPAVAPTPSVLSTKQPKNRHRKQRSILMTFMASIVGPKDVVPPTPVVVTTAPVVPPPIAPPPPPSLSPRALRRRARSTLVDTFRQYVQAELAQRIPPGGYYTWITTSMLRRASERMAHIVEQAGDAAPALVQQLQLQESLHHADDPSYFACNTPAPTRSPFSVSSSSSSEDGELEDGTDADTDTDGSSLHTPCSSTFSPSPRATYYQDDDDDDDAGESVPHQATGGLSAEACIAYTAYASMASRLRQLLVMANARTVHFDGEVKARDAVLEIRSRRRAWLNGALEGGGGKEWVGLAAPFKPSLLGLHYWSARDVVEEVFGEVEVEVNEWCSDAGMFTAGELGEEDGDSYNYNDNDNDEEEEEEDDDDDDYDYALDDLPGSWHREDVRAPAPTTTATAKTHRRPSICRNSTPYSSPPRPTLSATSPLCKPLARMSVASSSEKPPTYSELDPSRVAYADSDSEFTLAMDVPFTVRVPERAAKRGRQQQQQQQQQRQQRQQQQQQQHKVAGVDEDQDWFSQAGFVSGVQVGGI